MTTALPRDKDGKIIIGPLPLFGEVPAEEPAPVLRTAPVGAAPPRRPVGDLPTPFGQQQAAQPVPAPTWRQWVAYTAAGLLLALAAWAMLAQPAPQAPSVSPTAAVTPMPTEGALELPRPTLERAVVAFAEPGGAPVGALEPGRVVLMIEERGPWRLLDAEGSGEVWVRAWEMDGHAPPVPTALPPTAAPLPAPAPVYVAPAPAQTDWASMPVVGRAESPDGVYVCESRVSQADAEACVAALMRGE